MDAPNNNSKIEELQRFIQLEAKRLGLSPLEAVEILGDLCGYDVTIAEISYKRVQFFKESGGIRVLHIPNDKLMAVQRNILVNELYKLPVSDMAHCAVPGRSPVTNATEHIGANAVFKLDFKDAFPSTTTAMVESALSKAITEVTGDQHAAEARAKILAHITTYKNQLPQGAPTSPYLLNIVCRDLASELDAFLMWHDLTGTIYADDITVSAKAWAISEDVRLQIQGIAERHGYRINEAKTSYHHSGACDAVVTGISIKGEGSPLNLGLPRKVLNGYRGYIQRAILDTQIEAANVLGVIGWVTEVYGAIPERLQKPFQKFLKARCPTETQARFTKYFTNRAESVA